MQEPLSPLVEVASRLLSGVIGKDHIRTLADRGSDLRHALDMAAELLRLSEGHCPPVLEHVPTPRPSIAVRERVVDREFESLQELLAARRSKEADAAPVKPSNKGRTLH